VIPQKRLLLDSDTLSISHILLKLAAKSYRNILWFFWKVSLSY